jgi:uncharacterized protein (DUF2147 family)
VLLLILISTMAARQAAAAGDAITGLWEVADSSGRIEISRCGSKYCGAIAWQREPLYPPDDKSGMGGRPLLDRENPQKELRSRQQLGLQIMEGYTFRGNNFWDDGTIYNTENGKTYRSSITLLNHNRLELRGFIGIPLLGGTTAWKRVR